MTETKTTRRAWLRGLAAAGLLLAPLSLHAEGESKASEQKETEKKETEQKETEKKETEQKETEKKETEQKETEKKDTEKKETEKEDGRESTDGGASAAPELASYPMLILSGTALVSFFLGRQVGSRKKT